MSIAARIPSLDGIRAVSIALVLIAHIGGTAGAPYSGAQAVWLLDPGRLGVRVFFVISGFLITDLLLREREATGSISWPAFYRRRTLRIFPAFFVFLGAMLGANAAGFVELLPGDAWHAATYTMNYHAERAWTLGHLWSLSVEEQFYLLWPMLLVLAGARGAFRAAAGFVVVASILRLVITFVPTPTTLALRPLVQNSFETVGDAIAAGCFLAGYRTAWWERERVRAFYASRWFALVPGAVLAAAWVGSDSTVLLAHRGLIYAAYLGLGIPVMNVGIALSIDWAIRRPSGRIGRFLNARPVAIVGALSYSLYLWQNPFLNRTDPRVWTSFPLNLCLTGIAAGLSYLLVEQPVLKLRRRWDSGRSLSAEPV